MSILEVIILVVSVIGVAALIAFNMQRGTKALSEFKMDYDNNAEVQEVVELAKELYNKDLRPTPVNKAPKKKKSEFPINQPAKAQKAVEVTSKDITPEVIKKAVELAKQAPEEIAKTVVQEVEPQVTTQSVEVTVEVVKPSKKRKYYPKKPKTNI